MLRGHVTPAGEPMVRIVLLMGRRRVRKMAVVDTGFNGYISVPAAAAKGWDFFGYEQYEIATGDIVEQRVFLGRIEWNQQVQAVYAVTSNASDILIGTKLLQQNTLSINFPKRHVVILS